MNTDRYILSQILDLVHWQTLSRLVEHYSAESHVRHFSCHQQLICMAFAQLTWREGLRDIVDCLFPMGLGTDQRQVSSRGASEQKL